ncbi:MAG: mechanosensitive ion channel, partial [Clostridia bacterium]|nr:mechanosensitive ion channel [Clostridia bacterium]
MSNFNFIRKGMNISMSFFEQFKKWGFENLPEKILDFLPNLIAFILVLVIGCQISKLIGKLLVNILRRNGVDYSIHRFLQRSVVIFCNTIVVVIALEQIGITLNSLITAIGAAGITAGLGLQNSIGQFASGIQILFNKPFKSGDYIKLENVEGKVKEIRFMFTTLITNDNKVVVVPNQNITTKNLINYTAQDKMRVDLVYFIGYNDDIEKAKSVLMETARSCEHILKDP